MEVEPCWGLDQKNWQEQRQGRDQRHSLPRLHRPTKVLLQRKEPMHLEIHNKDFLDNLKEMRGDRSQGQELQDNPEKVQKAIILTASICWSKECGNYRRLPLVPRIRLQWSS